jgi:type IV pilus assembly protein PilM
VPAQPSIWKKEIKLRRDRPAAVQEAAAQPETPGPEAVLSGTLRPQIAIDPRFRRIDVLSRLVEEYADEFPDRVDERRKMLARLAESAEDGILPPDLDGVIHTLFYDLLRRGLKPSKGFWKRENQLPRQRKAPAKKIAAVAPVREPQPEQARPAANNTPFWKKEISLGRSAQPKQKVAAPADEKTPFWKKELSLGRSAQPKEKVADPVEIPAATDVKTSFLKKELSLGRSARPKTDRPTRSRRKLTMPKLERKPKATKEPKLEAETTEAKSLLKRDLRLPKPSLSLPGFSGLSLSSFRGRDATKIVGLHIGSSQLAAAVVDNNGSAEVLQLARSPLERGIVAAGEVRDGVALADALKRFFAQHGLPRRGVRLGIATNRIGVRVLEVPPMDDPRQLANAIRFRAQEVLPIPIAEAVLDHIVIEHAKEEGEQNRVLLVFAHRDLVDGYMDACNRAGIKLLGIDFDAFALLRALTGETSETEEPDERRAALIAVSIGHERTIFAVSDGNVCDFARVLEWGGSSLDAALARALELDSADAERVKQLLTLSGDAEIEGISPLQLEAARAAVKQELQLLARELVSSLQFYQSRPGSLDIGEMLLTGGGAQLDGIDVELGRQLGVPVRLGDALQRVKLGKDVAHPASPSLTIAVGLGIEEKA